MQFGTPVNRISIARRWASMKSLPGVDLELRRFVGFEIESTTAWIPPVLSLGAVLLPGEILETQKEKLLPELRTKAVKNIAAEPSLTIGSRI